MRVISQRCLPSKEPKVRMILLWSSLRHGLSKLSTPTNYLDIAVANEFAVLPHVDLLLRRSGRATMVFVKQQFERPRPSLLQRRRTERRVLGQPTRAGPRLDEKLQADLSVNAALDNGCQA